MSASIRRATADDAGLLAQHRGAVWVEVGDHSHESMRQQAPIWAAWIRDAIDDGTYVAFVAEDAGGIVASAALLVHVAVPRPGWPADREGRVHSVYVVPEARRRGLARKLVDEVLAYARAAMLIRLTLHPSADARPLYVALGFVSLDEMGLRLTGE